MPIQQELEIGTTFATLILNYVKKSCCHEMVKNPNESNHRDKVHSFEEFNKFYPRKKEWIRDKNKLREVFLKDEDGKIKEWKQEFNMKISWKQRNKQWIILVLMLIIVVFLIFAGIYWQGAATIVASIVNPLLVLIVGYIFNAFDFEGQFSFRKK